MSVEIPEDRQISFAKRPTPIPGDMRISWRVSLIMLMLDRCRSKRASLAKLHLLNDAVRSEYARGRLARLFSDSETLVPWHIRVEPAFGRAINFVIGEKFATWHRVANRAGLKLTEPGLKCVEALGNSEALNDEIVILESFAKPATEEVITSLIGRSMRV